jgi:hypothetical protein
MRKFFGAMGFAAACLSPATVSARVAPMTPEQQVRMDRQVALENAMRARFSDATFNQVRDMHASIIVAEEQRGVPTLPRVLVKDEHGWHELARDGRRALPQRISHELDRLMLDGDLWREEPYVAGQPCRGPTRVFLLRQLHHGDRYGRQPCGAAGLAGGVAEVAATLRIPQRVAATTAPPEATDAPPGVSAAEYKASRQMHALLEHSVWSWERRSLAGFVDPYAENVLVELPGRTLRGRAEVIAWAKGLRDWSPGGGFPRMTLHRAEWPRPQQDYAFGRWEVRWGEGQGRPMRRTYSATWRNNGGLWQIVHMKVSADKPVTDQRIAW